MRPQENSNGWVKLWRRLLGSEIWTKCPEAWGKVWVTILLTVKHQPWLTPEGVTMPPGSRGFTLDSLAAEAGTTVRKVRGTLRVIKTTHMATYFTTRTGSYITVSNWERYQGRQDSDDILSDTDSASKVTHGTTNINKEEEERRLKEEINSLASASADDPFRLTPPRPKKAKATYPAEFEEFWALYPWKKGRKPCAEKFAIEAGRVTAAVIIEGLRKQLPELSRQRTGYQLSPLTWLNQARWEDEVIVIQKGRRLLDNL